MDATEKKSFYIDSIQEAFYKKEYKKVITLWDSLMNEKADTPCGFEPNAELILSVRKRVINIILVTAKHLES